MLLSLSAQWAPGYCTFSSYALEERMANPLQLNKSPTGLNGQELPKSGHQRKIAWLQWKTPPIFKSLTHTHASAVVGCQDPIIEFYRRSVSISPWQGFLHSYITDSPPRRRATSGLGASTPLSKYMRKEARNDSLWTTNLQWSLNLKERERVGVCSKTCLQCQICDKQKGPHLVLGTGTK